MNDFSYQAYIELIQALKTALPLTDFSDITPQTTHFFILRHDVEFSVEKAYELACIEQEKLGITSSYFFQTRNNSYNPFSFHHMALIKQIHAMGHHIGLHVNTSGLSNLNDVENFICADVALLQQGLGLSIDRFSFHRPSFSLLASNIQIEGLINTYDPLYFQLYQGEKPASLNIAYFSDSEHRWKYGKPHDGLNQKINKIQLLIHPYSWSKQGLNNQDNFKELIQLKYMALLQAMHSECCHFPKDLLTHAHL